MSLCLTRYIFRVNMNNLLFSSVVRKTLANIARKFHKNVIFSQLEGSARGEGMQVNNPFCLEEISAHSHTFRKHDQDQRQHLYDFGVYVAACLPKYVQKVQQQHTDELEILVEPEGIFPVLSFMAYHQHACFNQCTSVTAIDVPNRVFRFEVIYLLLSLRFSERIRIKTYTNEVAPLRSASSIWQSAGMHEREVYDMFGVIFTHHPDLRRVLTDYGFDGHPLRKDFPLIGYIEVRYDDELKKIVYEPIEFTQEMRNYKLESPWNYFRNFHEGYNTPLPPKPPK